MGKESQNILNREQTSNIKRRYPRILSLRRITFLLCLLTISSVLVFTSFRCNSGGSAPNSPSSPTAPSEGKTYVLNENILTEYEFEAAGKWVHFSI